MSVTTVTAKQLVTNTRSDDILDGDGTVATTPTDGWSVSLGSQGQVERALFKFLADGTGDTVTFLAGDHPMSANAGKGNMTVTLAASDVRYIMIEGGRFLHDDGTVKATCVDAGTTMLVFLLPVATFGGSGIA